MLKLIHQALTQRCASNFFFRNLNIEITVVENKIEGWQVAPLGTPNGFKNLITPYANSKTGLHLPLLLHTSSCNIYNKHIYNRHNYSQAPNIISTY